jgi:hypothetical protein
MPLLPALRVEMESGGARWAGILRSFTELTDGD